jgi:hypothetical protein
MHGYLQDLEISYVQQSTQGWANKRATSCYTQAPRSLMLDSNDVPLPALTKQPRPHLNSSIITSLFISRGLAKSLSLNPFKALITLQGTPFQQYQKLQLIANLQLIVNRNNGTVFGNHHQAQQRARDPPAGIWGRSQFPTETTRDGRLTLFGSFTKRELLVARNLSTLLVLTLTIDRLSRQKKSSFTR